MKKSSITKLLTISLMWVFMIMSIPMLSSCVPVVEFGDLTVCRDIDPETSEPISPDTEFEFDIQKIYIVIKASGVDADDIKRFTLKNKETGEIILDESDKYMSGENGPVKGYFRMELSIAEGKEFMLAPGRYSAEFYHKGELKDTQDFTIKEPVVEVLEVVLADQVDENTNEPISVTSKFLDTDDFYAVLKINNNRAGDYYEAKWSYSEEGIINTTRIDVEEDYYGENYLSFRLFSEKLWAPGDYSVDLYHNDSLIGQYNFTVVSTQAQEGSGDNPFSQENVYINEDFGFGFAVPDGWELYEGIEGEELTIEIVYEQDPDVYLYFSFYVTAEGAFFDPGEYGAISEEFLNTALGSDEVIIIDESSGQYVNANGYDYYEYNYLIEDENADEWNIILDYFEGNNRTYMMISIAGEQFYNAGAPLYQGILSSFTILG